MTQKRKTTLWYRAVQNHIDQAKITARQHVSADTVHFICLAMIGSQRSDRIGLEIHPTV